MYVNNILGKKLRNLRKECEMTQDDIAEVLDMSRTSFSKYENGASTPPLTTLRKLATIYNVPLDYLIYDDNTIIFNENDKNELPDIEDVEDNFTKLSKEEKMVIMKFRLLNDEKKEKMKKMIDSET